jgi:RNA polymerase sigma-70 factor (ECF subfamily)
LDNDEQVYARVRAGDREALAVLVERYQSPLTKFLFRMTGQAQTAEDLVQEAFVRLLTYRGAPPERFRPWVFTIAHNLACDTFRSAAVRRETEELPEEEQGSGWIVDPHDVESLVLQAADYRQVNALLQRLPVGQREVLVLRFYHELPLEEIARITRAPLGTVKSRLFHGLRRARSILEQEEESHDEKSS